MKRPKSEIRNPWEPRCSKFEAGAGMARRVLGYSRKRRATPLSEALAVRPQRRRRSARPAYSKTCRVSVALCLLTSGLCLRVWGQSYSIDWFTIDGGGGTSTSGVYTVSGTIGQPDAGTMSGGIYALVGGFWSPVAAVQTPGAPHLSITRSNNTEIVWWPTPAAGWVLEWTNALPQSSAPWPQIQPPYATNGTNLQFTEPSPIGSKFYRLHKP